MRKSPIFFSLARLFRVRLEGPCSVPLLASLHSGLQDFDLDSVLLSDQGTFREVPGASRVEDCQLCHPGTFCGREGLAKPQGLCRAGYHCGPGSNTSSPVSVGPLPPRGKAGLSTEAWARSGEHSSAKAQSLLYGTTA